MFQKNENVSFTLTHKKINIMGSFHERKVACSASDRQGSNFESFVWNAVSSHSARLSQGVFLAQFSLYVHKGGLKNHLILFHRNLRTFWLIVFFLSLHCTAGLPANFHVTLDFGLIGHELKQNST